MASVGKRVLSKKDVLRKLKEIKPFLRENYGVVRLGLFGSVVREESTESSDLDILISVNVESFSLIDFLTLKHLLEDLFGREVDLVMDDAIKPRLKSVILKEVVYV
ncbi:nucleotidyltransferase family protein [Thermovibrio sp.]